MLHLLLTALLFAESSKMSDGNAVENIWPTLEISYEISPELAGQKDAVLSAMATLSRHTCVSFHKRTSETDYLLFKVSPGCGSYVGFIAGEQPVFIGPECTMGSIAHEVLHALGLHHEHTRADRGKYITVLPNNIMKATSLPTILSRIGVKDMGQRVKLRNMDIVKVRLLYSCDDHEEMGDDNVPHGVDSRGHD